MRVKSTTDCIRQWTLGWPRDGAASARSAAREYRANDQTDAKINGTTGSATVLRSIRLVVTILCCLGFPLRAQQASPGVDSAWADTDTTHHRPVLFTISGGISLGSYQSGVNWALVRFIRNTRDDAGYRQSKFLPQLRFAAMAGASAGNINALMSAIAWCTERPGERPDSSIFWKTWVYTGWEELYPVQRVEGGGVFDRTYYRTGPLEWLKLHMDRLRYPADCDIPLGMTMTRVEPTTTAITNNVSASTQRYATLVRVQASRTNPTKLHFIQPDSTLFHPSLGALASLAVAAGDTIPATQVLNALMASSAFPVAFADVGLSYIPGDRIASGSACAKREAICGDWIRAQFIDGGLFDNNPLALALGIFRLDSAGEGATVSGRGGRSGSPARYCPTPCAHRE